MKNAWMSGALARHASGCEFESGCVQVSVQVFMFSLRKRGGFTFKSIIDCLDIYIYIFLVSADLPTKYLS